MSLRNRVGNVHGDRQLSTEQLEFLAEETIVKIVPNFRVRANRGYLNFISGDFGPFIPQVPVSVPLWLAITLKKRQKCQISPPEWMNAEYLNRKLDEERHGQELRPLPFHFMEIASLLLNNASDDIADVDRIRTLLEDVENVRQTKIRHGITQLAEDVEGGQVPFSMRMDNLGAIEINSIRPFLLQALDKFYHISMKKNGPEEDTYRSQTLSQSLDTQLTTPDSAARTLRRFR